MWLSGPPKSVCPHFEWIFHLVQKPGPTPMHTAVWDAPLLMLQTLRELAEFSVRLSQVAVVSRCVLGELFRLGHYWPRITEEPRTIPTRPIFAQKKNS